MNKIMKENTYSAQFYQYGVLNKGQNKISEENLKGDTFLPKLREQNTMKDRTVAQWAMQEQSNSDCLRFLYNPFLPRSCNVPDGTAGK